MNGWVYMIGTHYSKNNINRILGIILCNTTKIVNIYFICVLTERGR